ncbi:MAG: hypothetical protein JJ979_17295 [Roseibium sp.]|nr:hypothetical protein [Roseibium sp.]
MSYKVGGVVVIDGSRNLSNLHSSSVASTSRSDSGSGTYYRYIRSYVQISGGKPRLRLLQDRYNCDDQGTASNCFNCDCDCRC